jgi:hypothetical protein
LVLRAESGDGAATVFGGHLVRVRSLRHFSGGGGGGGCGIDAISGEGRRSLLLLLVFFYEDVDDGVFPGEQD